MEIDDLRTRNQLTRAARRSGNARADTIQAAIDRNEADPLTHPFARAAEPFGAGGQTLGRFPRSSVLFLGSPDSDGDGVPDASDNCPGIVNPDQQDADGDTVGDACDNCPEVPNPDQSESEPAGSFGPQQVISTAVNGSWSVFAADLDDDGDSDVLSASYNDDKIDGTRTPTARAPSVRSK